jgi:peptidase M28-like protein
MAATEAAVQENGEPGIRRVLLSVAVLAAMFLFSLAGLRPPKPKAPSVPAGQFSAGRALEVLKRVIHSEIPHPVGSAANEVVRQHIVEEFGKLGYKALVQTTFACGRYGSCATVSNVLAKLNGLDAAQATAAAGDGGTPAVLIAAHYDSVPAAPGVSDDGVGTATVLEVARALKSLPTPRHSVIFLIDDGEEPGLLGARAFVGQNPWSKDVRAVVNLEARGTSGPSLMFETGTANQWAARLYAQSAHYPTTSSILYALYKLLPNDTDFTIFKSAGYQGLNFAFIGDEPQYHTPLDNIANLSAASLQHQGDNALSSITSLANADLARIPEDEAVYFDLFQIGTVRFPAKWTIPLALLTMLLLAVPIGRLVRNKKLTLRELLWGAVLWLAIIVATGILALILGGLMRFVGAILVNWVAHPFPVELAFWSLAAAAVFTLGILFGRHAGFWGLWAGVWVWWALLSLVAACLASGVSYVFLVPAGIASLVALLCGLGHSARTQDRFASVTAMLPLTIAGAVGFAPLLLLYDGIGNRALPSLAVLVAVLLTPLLPLCADILSTPGIRGAMFSWIPITVALTGAFVAVVVPQFSAKSPERVNILYWQDADTSTSQWIVEPDSGRLPEAIRVAANFKHADKGPFPWDRGPAFLTPAPRLAFSAPSFTILESSSAGNQRIYRVLLRSERGAPEALALFPPNSGVKRTSMQGQPIEPAAEKLRYFWGDWDVYRCLTMPPEGVEITFTLPIGKPLEVYVLDVSYGLPAEGKFLLNSRPLTATPSHDGDMTVLSRREQLLP